jgi:hypothetical protein
MYTLLICSYCAYNGEMLFWMVVLTRVCAKCHIGLYPSLLVPLLQDAKINDAHSTFWNADILLD